METTMYVIRVSKTIKDETFCGIIPCLAFATMTGAEDACKRFAADLDIWDGCAFEIVPVSVAV